MSPLSLVFPGRWRLFMYLLCLPLAWTLRCALSENVRSGPSPYSETCKVTSIKSKYPLLLILVYGSFFSFTWSHLFIVSRNGLFLTVYMKVTNQESFNDFLCEVVLLPHFVLTPVWYPKFCVFYLSCHYFCLASWSLVCLVQLRTPYSPNNQLG